MHELIVNLHIHTPYSDGFGSHTEIAQAALRAGVDVVIVTDHNVLVDGPEDYYSEGDRRVLLLVGEEIHDQARNPQKNHLLVFGAGRELAPQAADPQKLLDAVNQAGGLSFLAHIVDPASSAFKEPDISWVDWNVQGYTGIELWNAMSEFKGLLKGKLQGLYYAYHPEKVALGPFEGALRKWDELLSQRKRVVAIGGSDAHAFRADFGPLHRVLFPYEFHFRTVNTHLLIPIPPTGDVAEDRRLIFDAFRRGHAFIGYDLPAPTRGFRFIAHGIDTTATMGDEVSSARGITFQISLPRATECRLLHNGQIVKTWLNTDHIVHITSEPGVYRVECYMQYQGRMRGWIFSNPIYVR